MPWVRLDDKFPSHPKVAELTDREFRVYIRVLCYVSEYRTGGVIPPSIWREVPGLTPKIGVRFVELGLWDDDFRGHLAIHDFDHYNPRDPSHAERQRRYRQRQRDGNSDVTRDGERDEIRDALARAPAGASPAPSPTPAPKGLTENVVQPSVPSENHNYGSGPDGADDFQSQREKLEALAASIGKEF